MRTAALGRQLPVAALLTFQLGNLLSLSDRPDSAKSGPSLIRTVHLEADICLPIRSSAPEKR